jgi:hypothetical protein
VHAILSIATTPHSWTNILTEPGLPPTPYSTAAYQLTKTASTPVTFIFKVRLTGQ